MRTVYMVFFAFFASYSTAFARLNRFGLDHVIQKGSQSCELIDVYPQGNGGDWVIVRRLAPKAFELLGCLPAGEVFGGACRWHGILISTKTNFGSTGEIHIYVTHLGSKELPTRDGFSAKFDYFKECASPEEKAADEKRRAQAKEKREIMADIARHRFPEPTIQ